MTRSRAADPFREATGRLFERRLRLLGAEFRFTADNRRLLGLVDAAFARLPPLRFAGPAVRLEVRLRLQSGGVARGEPPVARYSSGSGLLCGTVDADNFAVVDPAGKRAYVAISEAMLTSAYHARYELLEFAAMTLAARAQELVALHGACVARGGRGVLLLGASGAGKSTLCLHSLLEGFELVSEDSVFVEPATLRAVGLANFLHLRPEALRFLHTSAMAASLRASPTIRRRSGVRKFEFDVRESRLHVARRAPRIVAAVFVVARPGRRGAELARLDGPALAARLARDQPYAAERKGWRAFVAALRGGVYELRRGTHPDESVRQLQKLLGGAA
jgi:hypothetical protein